MRELKILAIVIFFTLVTYWGVEPFAHSQMHPHVAPADFSFKDLSAMEAEGSFKEGESLVRDNCTGCHSIKAIGIEPSMSDSDAAMAYGVVPPDLSSAGTLYEDTYLAHFIKDPVATAQLTHKFDETKAYPMPAYSWFSDKELMSIVAFFKNIAKPLSDKEVFQDACVRCHSMKYASLKAQTGAEQLKQYLGTEAPDLSMMIRSKKEEYLHTFINEPLKMLEGVAMPRVGLNEEAQIQVVQYMEKVGDSKKDEREALGYKLVGFMLIFTLIAYLWKVKIWKEVE